MRTLKYIKKKDVISFMGPAGLDARTFKERNNTYYTWWFADFFDSGWVPVDLVLKEIGDRLNG